MSEHTVQTSDQPLSSVEIASRAKGSPAITVKIYHLHPDRAASEAVRIYANVVDDLAHYGATTEE